MQRPPERLPKLDPRIRVKDLKIDSAKTDISTAPLLKSAISHTIECNGINYHFYKDYKHKLGILGAGAFGEVRLAQNEKTGEWVAIKKLERKPDPDINTQDDVIGPGTLEECINKQASLLEGLQKNSKFSPLKLGPFIRELRSLNAHIKYYRGKLPRASDDLEQLQRELHKLLDEIDEYLKPVCKNDEPLTSTYKSYQDIRDKIDNEQRYLNAFENELRNLNNLGEYLFHLENDGESYIGLRLYEGHQLTDFLPPTRTIKKPPLPGINRSAEKTPVSTEQKIKLTKRQKYFIISRLLDAVRAMHAGELRGEDAALGARKDFSIIHRDLKPSNIIVDDQLDVHVVDKGLATAVEFGSGVVSDRAVGTKAYMAPECTGDVYEGTHYSEKSDVYSVGKVLARFMDIAVVEKDVDGVTSAILLEGVDYKKINGQIYSLIESLQAQERDDRPTSKDAFDQFEQLRNKMHDMMSSDKFICYTIKLSDLARIVCDHKLTAFAKKLAAEGACSIAFVRDTDSVTQNDIVRMMRKLRHEGVMHFAPDVYPKESATQNISQYYQSVFITQDNEIRSSREIAKQLRVISQPTTIPMFERIRVPSNLQQVRAGGHRAKSRQPQKTPHSNNKEK